MPEWVATRRHSGRAGPPHVIAERFLVRKGATDDGQWEQLAPFQEMEIGVPHELGKLIELELDRLSISEQRVLEAGSLMMRSITQVRTLGSRRASRGSKTMRAGWKAAFRTAKTLWCAAI